jgi:hypothetical protein
MTETLKVRKNEMVNLGLELGQDAHTERCGLCWQHECSHDTYSIQDDPFINLTEEEWQYA